MTVTRKKINNTSKQQPKKHHISCRVEIDILLEYQNINPCQQDI
jgi:hypothetical protein